MKDLQTIKNVGADISLLNNIKFEIITSDHDVVTKFRAVAPNIVHVKPSDELLLGSFSEDSEESFLSSKLANVSERRKGR